MRLYLKERLIFNWYRLKNIIRLIFKRIDWWKISEDNGIIYDCCETCFWMCPECEDCHRGNGKMDYNEMVDMKTEFLTNNIGIGCPHKNYSSPQGER